MKNEHLLHEMPNSFGPIRPFKQVNISGDAIYLLMARQRSKVCIKGRVSNIESRVFGFIYYFNMVNLKEKEEKKTRNELYLLININPDHLAATIKRKFYSCNSGEQTGTILCHSKLYRSGRIFQGGLSAVTWKPFYLFISVNIVKFFGSRNSSSSCCSCTSHGI